MLLLLLLQRRLRAAVAPGLLVLLLLLLLLRRLRLLMLLLLCALALSCRAGGIYLIRILISVIESTSEWQRIQELRAGYSTAGGWCRFLECG